LLLLLLLLPAAPPWSSEEAAEGSPTDSDERGRCPCPCPCACACDCAVPMGVGVRDLARGVRLRLPPMRDDCRTGVALRELRLLLCEWVDDEKEAASWMTPDNEDRSRPAPPESGRLLLPVPKIFIPLELEVMPPTSAEEVRARLALLALGVPTAAAEEELEGANPTALAGRAPYMPAAAPEVPDVPE